MMVSRAAGGGDGAGKPFALGGGFGSGYGTMIGAKIFTIEFGNRDRYLPFTARRLFTGN